MTKEDKQIIDRAVKESWRIGDRTRLKHLLKKNLILYRENEELKQQIEKMKCCFNCKHSRTEYEHCRTDKHEKWEIKENGN